MRISPETTSRPPKADQEADFLTSRDREGADSQVTIIESFDPGWLFLLVGLVLLSSAVLIPPADDLTDLTYQRDLLIANEQQSIGQLQAYSNFLESVETEDPDLVRRLTAADMNRIPQNSIPVAMIGPQLDVSIDHWIHDTLPESTPVNPPVLKGSFLRRWCTGPYRLWTMAAGAILILIGLIPRDPYRAKLDSGSDSVPSAEGESEPRP